jgi:hypothetical protein
MGIDCEAIFLRDQSSTAAISLLDQVLAEHRRTPSERRADRDPIPRRDFESRKTRYFAIRHTSDGSQMLVEAGDLADWKLAVALSKKTDSRVLVLALHESSNAWAYTAYQRGDIVGSAFRPQDAFTEILPAGLVVESWDGDATEEMMDFAKTAGIEDPILSYKQVLAAMPSAKDQVVFRAYTR